MQTRLYSALTALLLFLGNATAQAQGIQVTNLDGGSVTIGIIDLNKGSSLRRWWVVLNDPSCPIQLENAGIETTYNERFHNCEFRATGSAKASKAVRAFEVRFVLYDVFGDYMTTLAATEVTDLASGATYSFRDVSWNAPMSHASQLLKVVAFVARVRTEDSTIWRFDAKVISDELARIRLKATGVLEPTKVKEK